MKKRMIRYRMRTKAHQVLAIPQSRVRTNIPIIPATKAEKLKMAWQLLEETTSEDKKRSDSYLKPILSDICARLETIESSTQKYLIS